MVNQPDSSEFEEKYKERILKLVIIGKPEVGKTSLRRTFMGNKFRQNYLPTLGADFSLFEMDYLRQRVKTTLWDLSGQVRFSKVHPQYYLGSHGAIVLYDIHSENPEDELINWIDTFLEHVGRIAGPVLIVQNKIDLIGSNHESMMSIKHEKLVRNIEIYYENRLTIFSGRTSAKTGENVQPLLEGYIQKLVDRLERGGRQFNPRVSNVQTNHTLAGYILTFENFIGPIIVHKSPPQPDLDYSIEEETSVVNLSAGINLEELVEQKYETGTAMWSKPESLFYYIAFVIENPVARGGYDLYILGLNLARQMKYVISGSLNLIQGYLTQAMNKFSDFLNSTDYSLSDEHDLIRLHQSNEDLDRLKSILETLRTDIHKIIQEKLDQ